MSAPPRVQVVPDVEANYDLADAAVELATSCGLVLDSWQEDLLRAGLAFRPDGKWVAEELGGCVPRQNGKNGVTEVRQLAGLFLVREFPVLRHPDPLAIHTAHLNDTAAEAFRRLEMLIDGNDELRRRVKRVSYANGKEAIETRDGERIRYRARTKGGGRGYAGDDLYLDEAMGLPEFGYGALRPVLSARPNPQIWYTGSAVDQDIHDDGVVFARVRERGMGGEDPRLAYFEWSLPYETPNDVPAEALTDPEAWAQANPALGVRIMAESIESEQRSMADRSFIVERLGVGDWPDTDASHHVIDMDLWAELADFDSKRGVRTFFGVDVAPDRTRAAISVASRRPDDLVHLEVVRSDRGTSWVVPEVVRLAGKYRGSQFFCDSRSGGASLVPELARQRVELEAVDASGMARACGRFFDAVVEDRTIRHLATPELTNALKGAAKRPLGDAWAWDKKKSSVDISPLVACTLALWGLETRPGPSVYASRGVAVI